MLPRRSPLADDNFTQVIRSSGDIGTRDAKGGELTLTLKLKRRVVEAKHRTILDALYDTREESRTEKEKAWLDQPRPVV